MSAGFEDAFQALRKIMLAPAGGLVIARDNPGDLVVRTPVLDAKGEAGWFGTVTIKKSYVAFHLMPLYVQPDLADGLSTGLTRRKQGKTCFNFKQVEPELFDELAALTASARGAIDIAG